MSSQYLKQDVEARLDRGDPRTFAFGNAGPLGAALDDESRRSTRVRNTQTDPALRHSRAARDGFECEQHPVRLEGFALPHRKEKAPAPADQLANRGLDRAASLGQLIDLGVENGRQRRA